MKTARISLLLMSVLVLLVGTGGNASARLIFVDEYATGNNDGASWANAYRYLQDAMAIASSGDRVRVAEGAYKPDRGTGRTRGLRTATFRLQTGVILRGGYAGFGEPDPNAWDPTAYETILSGDLNGDDGPNFANNGENSYHVVVIGPADRMTILDGFTITAGSANAASSQGSAKRRGGGIYIGGAEPTITNCIISGNWARIGGGIYCQSANPTISNCTIADNAGQIHGGGIDCFISTLIIDNCIISGNSATRTGSTRGGGIACYNSSATITNTLISGNSSALHTGGIYGAGLNLTNCTIVGNTAQATDGGISASGSTITNCVIWGNSDGSGEGESAQIRATSSLVMYCCVQGWTGSLVGVGNFGEDPLLASDGYHLEPDSPCINTGDPVFDPGPDVTDIDRQPRVMQGRVDIGADEYGTESPPLIAVMPNQIDLIVPIGGSSPSPQILSVRNIGIDMLNWQIAENCDWLDVLPTAGESSGEVDEVVITTDIGGLDAGQEYNCVLIVSDGNAINGPKTANVSLYISKVRYVPDEYSTIQAAIDECIDGEEVIVGDGIYTGVGNVNLSFRGKAITVRSENGPENCIIDCNGAERGFGFGKREDANSLLEGFTITRASRGGIVCSYYASPTIMGCIITANGGLGGIYCSDRSSPLIKDCVISNNSKSRGHGGGIHCTHKSSPTIVNCAIIGNSSESGGGGIFCGDRSYPTIINCTISGNSTRYGEHGGGGISCEYGGATIINCRFTGNSAPGDGGAIYADMRCVLTGCTFSGNRAGGKGGGIFSSSDLLLTNCTVSGNLAGETGGGIAGGTISLTNCIVWDNSDSTGSGQSSQVEVDPLDIYAIYSCIEDDDPDDANIPFDDAGENYNIDDDPMFVRSPDDGGDGWGDDPETPDVNEAANDDFGDVHLQIASPCINTGVPTFAAGPNAVDMDDEPRVIGLRVDMGADEYSPMIVVTKPEGGEIWTAGSLHVVEWSSYGTGAVDILLSVDGGGSWETVESGVSDSGIYMWDVSASIDSDQCVISVVPSVPDANVVTIESGIFSVWPYHGPASLPRRRGWRPRAGERYGPEYGCVKWKFETDGPVTTAVTVGREIKKTTKAYIACEDGKLYALDADTGAVVWSYDTNTPLFGSAAEGRDGTVYVGSEGGKLYAIDKKGQLLWTHTTGGSIYSTPAVTPTGRIYVCSVDGLLYALARDGSDLWSFETNGFAALGGSVLFSPQEAADGSVYIAGLYDPNLYALNREDGSVKWACNFEFVIDPCDPNSGTKAGWPFASPAIGPDGTVYQTLLYDSNLYAIDAGTGGIIWSVELADPCSGWFEPNDLATLRYSDGWSSPVVGPNWRIYVSLDDPYLRAVNHSGGIDWVTKLGEMGGFTLTVGSDGLIYAASDDNNLYVVNAEGAEIAQFVGDDWLSHPVIGADGTLYVSDANNAVWAISEEACNGKTPVLNGAGAANPKKPVKFRGRQVRKSKAGLRVRK